MNFHDVPFFSIYSSINLQRDFKLFESNQLIQTRQEFEYFFQQSKQKTLKRRQIIKPTNQFQFTIFKQGQLQEILIAENYQTIVNIGQSDESLIKLENECNLVDDCHCQIDTQSFCENGSHLLQIKVVYLLFCLNQLQKQQKQKSSVLKYLLPIQAINKIQQFCQDPSLQIQDISGFKYRTLVKVRTFADNLNNQMNQIFTKDKFSMGAIDIEIEDLANSFEEFIDKNLDNNRFTEQYEQVSNRKLAKLYHFLKYQEKSNKFIGISENIQTYFNDIQNNKLNINELNYTNFDSILNLPILKLSILNLSLKPQTYTIIGNPQKIYSIGRQINNDIEIKHPTISREHASIRTYKQSKDKWMWKIFDGQNYQSTNGLWKCLKKKESYSIYDSDTLRISDYDIRINMIKKTQTDQDLD